MAQRSTGNRARTALTLVVVAALVAAGGAWLAWRQAEALVDRALKIALGSGQSAHRSLMLQPDGQIVVEDLVFIPADAPDVLRAERLAIETPGWRWFLRNALDPELRDARLDRLRLSLDGVRVDDDGALPVDDLGVFGATSASPWDADGCPPEVRWTRQTLAEAGLASGSPSLQFDYRPQAGDLLVAVTFENYGVSRLQRLRIGSLPGGEGNLLQLATEPGVIRSEHWNVQDQGFVAARNRYCAGRSDVDERRFVARHVDAVTRRLAMLGLEVDAQTRNRYRRFALAGGRLSLSVALPRPMTASTLRQLHRSAAWSDTVTTLDRSGDVSTLQWRRIATAPVSRVAAEIATDAALPPGLADGFEVVAPEPDSTTTDAAIAAVPPPTNASPIDAPEAVPVDAPRGMPVDSPVSFAATPARAVAAEPRAEPSSGIASARPAIRHADPLTRFTTPLPETAARAAIRSTARVVPTRTAAPATQALSWNELRTVRGREIEIWTRRSPARRVQILEFGGDAVLVSYRIKNSGEATFSIRRDAFLRALLKS